MIWWYQIIIILYKNDLPVFLSSLKEKKNLLGLVDWDGKSASKIIVVNGQFDNSIPFVLSNNFGFFDHHCWRLDNFELNWFARYNNRWLDYFLDFGLNFGLFVCFLEFLSFVKWPLVRICRFGYDYGRLDFYFNSWVSIVDDIWNTDTYMFSRPICKEPW